MNTIYYCAGISQHKSGLEKFNSFYARKGLKELYLHINISIMLSTGIMQSDEQNIEIKA